jgi:flagellar biosynthesis protein
MSSTPPPDETILKRKAVAVEYDASEGKRVPVVTASGRGYVAEQILAIAFAQGIKVREDADLVEILSQLDIDSPIPPEVFAVVAEILAYVYQANAGSAQRKQHERSR